MRMGTAIRTAIGALTTDTAIIRTIAVLTMVTIAPIIGTSRIADIGSHHERIDVLGDRRWRSPDRWRRFLLLRWLLLWREPLLRWWFLLRHCRHGASRYPPR